MQAKHTVCFRNYGRPKQHKYEGALTLGITGHDRGLHDNTLIYIRTGLEVFTRAPIQYHNISIK